MDYKLEELIDIKLLQELQDKLNVIYSFPSAIIDIDGKILTAVAWQDVCTNFHRVNPESKKECIKSDKYINEHLHEANPVVSYQCPHGLVDNATPIIIDGKHLGNFFTGQFFIEKPDVEFFKQQALRFGFNEEAYLEAVNKVPIWSREKLNQYLDFIKGFIEIIAGIGLKNLREIEANKRIQESEERYRQLFEAIPESVLLIGTDRCVVTANQASALLYGYELPEQLIGFDTRLLISEKDRKQAIMNQTNVLEGKELSVRHYTEVRRDGSEFIAEVISTTLHGPQQEVTGYIGITRDITAVVEAEKSMRESEEQFRSTFEQTSVGIAHISQEGKWLRVNQHLCDILGYTREELQSKSFQDITHPDDLITDINHMRRLFTDEIKSISKEKRYIKKDGSPIWVSLNSTTYRNADGKIEYIISIIKDISDRKAVEISLSKSEEKFAKAFRLNPSIMALTRVSDAICVEVNDTFIKVFGYSRDEIIGSSFVEKGIWVNPQEREMLITRLLRGDSLINIEVLFYTKDKQIITCSSSFETVEIEGEIFSLAVLEDITERKRVEEEIKDNESYLKSLVFMLQQESDSVEEYLDYALRETLRLTKSKLGYIYHYNEESKEFVLNTWSKEVMNECAILEKQTVYRLDKTGLWGEAVRQRKPIMVNDFQASHPHKKGYPEGHAHLNKFLTVPVFSNDKIVGVVGVANKEKDYTDADLLHLTLLMNSVWKVVDRKRSEEALSESQARFSATIEQSNDGITISDLDGNYLEVNPKFCSMTGYTRDELLKMHVSDLIPPNNPSILFSQVAQEKKSGHSEGEILRKDGTTFSALVTGSAIKVSDKYYAQGIVRDITDRKVAEIELDKYRHHLEELIKVRTEELNVINEELTKKIEREEELKLILQESLDKEIQVNEMKSRFISTATHEFKTPLTSILTSSGLIQRYIDRWTPEKRNEHFHRIQKSVQNLTKLVDDVLIISKTEHENASFNPELIDLQKYACECLDETKSLLVGNHKLKFNYKSEKKLFELDPKLLKFIFNNLLSNAIKYSPDGGRVDLIINSDEKEIIIQVKDEGIGIPDDDLGKIFDSFYRTKNADSIKGTGLGLAIVKRAVDLHGGEITVSSELNKGTTFTVKIPVN